MDPNLRTDRCVKVYADSLRKTIRLLTFVFNTWLFRIDSYIPINCQTQVRLFEKQKLACNCQR